MMTEPHSDINAQISATSLAELERDPYPFYAALRAEAPVAFVPAAHQWLVTRYDDVQFVGDNPNLFTSELSDSPQEAAFGRPTILTVDGPVHLDLRRAVNETLRPSRIRKSAPALCEPIISRQLDQLAGRRSADLVADYFEPISVSILGQVLGLGHIPPETLKSWYRALSLGAANFDKDPERNRICAIAAAEVDAEAIPLMAKGECPEASIMFSLMHGGSPTTGQRPIESVLPTLKIVLFAGMQEPAAGGAATMHGLLQHPSQLKRVVAEPTEYVSRAIEEGLRWVSPVGTQTREARTDINIGGTEVPAGSMIGSVLSSANRDERRFGLDADQFNLERSDDTQLAFGVGTHQCAGNALARYQMHAAITGLLQRFPNVELEPSRPTPYHGWEFRSLTALRVHLG